MKQNKYVEMTQSSSSDNGISHFNIKILNLYAAVFKLINTKSMFKKN